MKRLRDFNLNLRAVSLLIVPPFSIRRSGRTSFRETIAGAINRSNSIEVVNSVRVDFGRTPMELYRPTAKPITNMPFRSRVGIFVGSRNRRAGERAGVGMLPTFRTRGGSFDVHM